MEFDFSTRINRQGTGSLKWDKYGAEVLPFWVADMDFRVAPAIQAALARRLEHGVYGYTIPYAEAKDAVIRYMREVQGVEVDPSWLLWVPGLVPALNTAARAFGKEGDSILTCTPVYPPFLTSPGNQGRQCLKVPLMFSDGRYTFDFEAMEAAVQPSTVAFFLCNPHNPVGRVFAREELEALASFCQRHELILVSDEIHCDLILEEGLRHIPALALGEEVGASSITLMAPSKTYNIPGLACSFVIIPNASLRHQFERALRGMITEVNCFGYAACVAAYTEGESWRRALIDVLRFNRDRVYAFAAEHMPELGLKPMESTYLAWFDVRPLNLNQPAAHFEEYGIGLSDGGPFGSPGFLRLNFGCPSDLLEEGLERMKRACDAALARRAGT